MIVTKKHAILIKKISEKWEKGLPLDKIVDSLSAEELEYLFHLELAGLVYEENNSYELSQAGSLVAEAIAECSSLIDTPENWPESFRFIGSEIISMIEIVREAQSDAIHQREISIELEKRGLMKEGKLSPIAESILQAYNIAEPGIFITPSLAEKLKQTPPGPGKKNLLPLTKEEIFQLEAMRLLTFSVPFGNNYSLTGPGQQIRAGLLKGATVNFSLTDEILYSLLQEEIEDEIEKKLMLMGAIKEKNSLLPAGRHFKRAAELLYIAPISTNPSIDVDTEDLNVLQIINELWEKKRENPEIFPTYKQIRKEVETSSSPTTPWKTSYTLHILESFRLIGSEKNEKGELVYHLTEWGKKILEDRLHHNKKEVTSTAVMSITTTRMENLSPDDEWIEEAEREGLLGKGFPSKSGRLFAQLASTIERLPLISAFEARVLRTLPLWRGMFEKDILSRFPEKEKDHVKSALRKLIAHGLVDVLPGQLYKVTEAGEKFKRGIASVPDGIEFHVTPHLLRLLLAAAESSSDGRINWKETEKISRLDPETFEKTLSQATQSHFIRADKLTSAALLLIEGVLILKEAKTHWEETEL